MGLFSNYCGFGGSGIPQHRVDKICQEHDDDYQIIEAQGQDPYWNFNWADEKMLDAISKVAHPSFKEKLIREVATMVWHSKKATFPSLPNLQGTAHAQQTLTLRWENIRN